MKIMICGYARHGKDHAAEVIKRWFGLRHESSSNIAMRLFIREGLAVRHGLTYATEAECYADRVNHRPLWFDMVCEFNKEDPTRLTRAIFKDWDVYVGIRNVTELRAAKEANLVDLIIWVDGSERLPPENVDSNTITANDCDVTVTNNGTVEEFEDKLVRLFHAIY